MFDFAFALGIVGALTLIIINLLRLLGLADVIIPFYWLIPSIQIFPLIGGMSGDSIVSIVCGMAVLISSRILISSRRIHGFAWSIILMIAGVVAGGIGGALIIIGGILALISNLT